MKPAGSTWSLTPEEVQLIRAELEAWLALLLSRADTGHASATVSLDIKKRQIIGVRGSAEMRGWAQARKVQ